MGVAGPRQGVIVRRGKIQPRTLRWHGLRARYGALLTLTLFFNTGAQGALAASLAPKGADGPALTMAPVESDPEREEFARQVRLSLLQYQGGRAFEARNTVSDALEDIRARFGPWDQQQVLGLRILAAAEQSLGDVESAGEALAQAQYLNRMNLGLHDLSQLPILAELTQLSLRKGDFKQGNALQEYAFFIQQRTHGEDSEALLPALYNLGSWYLSTGNVLASRTLYERALDLSEDLYGETDLRLIPALRGLAGVVRAERFPMEGQNETPAFSFTAGGPNSQNLRIEDERMLLGRYGQGEDALQRVLEIYDAQESVEPTVYADGLIELGDLYLIFDKWTAAARRYGQAQTRLLEAGEENTAADALFATPKPVVLYLPEARAPSDRTGLEPQLGFVDYRYRVNTRGRAFDLEITDFGPKDVLNFRLKRALKEARFRPIMVAGEAMDSDWLEARHEFSFLGPPPAPEAAPEEDGDDLPSSESEAPSEETL